MPIPTLLVLACLTSSIPALFLTGCCCAFRGVPAAHSSAAASLTGGGAAADITAWCEFHNGVASGLKIAPYVSLRRRQRLSHHHQHQHQEGAAEGATDGAADEAAAAGTFDSSLADAWLPHSKPAVPNYAHAGVLLALGLNGHLDRLSWTDLYRCARGSDTGCEEELEKVRRRVRGTE